MGEAISEPVHAPAITTRRSFSPRDLAHPAPDFRQFVPYLYLCVALPAVLLLCFLVPPMQVPDENRHFERAYQIAQGGWAPDFDAKKRRAGGVLPDAVFNFVRSWMRTDVLQHEEPLRSIRARMHALDIQSEAQIPLTHKSFGQFAAVAIYPPGLYIPQAVGIALSRLFSDKVYIWFYSARLFNAVTCIGLIFLALHVAGPERSLFLLLPAVLPMSLYQFGSVSTDPAIIALSILFTALCIRFWTVDGALLRTSLVICLLLLVMGKPVHVALSLLLLTASGRLGWRRATSFFCIASAVACTAYLAWASLVRGFIALAGQRNGQDPSTQLRLIVEHPATMLKAIVLTIRLKGWEIAKQFIGVFGWADLPLPSWVICGSILVLLAVVLIVAANYRKLVPSTLMVGGMTVLALSLAVFMAGYVMWNPPGAQEVSKIQGRYFLPALPVLALVAPPIGSLGLPFRAILPILCAGYSVLSGYTAVRLASHYFFPQSRVVGAKIETLFKIVPNASCPASVEYHGLLNSWFQYVETGRTVHNGDYRVLFATDDRTIMSESDPAFTGAEFPYYLLPGSPRSRWRIRIWQLNRADTGRLWFVNGGTACAFGPVFTFQRFETRDE
jgi:uncharacterized membrane protein (UPF0136 family)